MPTVAMGIVVEDLIASANGTCEADFQFERVPLCG